MTLVMDVDLTMFKPFLSVWCNFCAKCWVRIVGNSGLRAQGVNWDALLMVLGKLLIQIVPTVV